MASVRKASPRLAEPVPLPQSCLIRDWDRVTCRGSGSNDQEALAKPAPERRSGVCLPFSEEALLFDVLLLSLALAKQALGTGSWQGVREGDETGWQQEMTRI